MPRKEWIKVVYVDGNIFVHDGVCVFRHALCHRPEGLEDLYLIRRHFIYLACIYTSFNALFSGETIKRSQILGMRKRQAAW